MKRKFPILFILSALFSSELNAQATSMINCQIIPAEIKDYFGNITEISTSRHWRDSYQIDASGAEVEKQAILNDINNRVQQRIWGSYAARFHDESGCTDFARVFSQQEPICISRIASPETLNLAIDDVNRCINDYQRGLSYFCPNLAITPEEAFFSSIVVSEAEVVCEGDIDNDGVKDGVDQCDGLIGPRSITTSVYPSNFDDLLVRGCDITCPSGYEKIGNECKEIKCKQNEELIAGVCMLKCQGDEIRIDGICQTQCRPGEVKINGICTLQCESNQEKIGNACYDKCPEFTTRDSSTRECRCNIEPLKVVTDKMALEAEAAGGNYAGFGEPPYTGRAELLNAAYVCLKKKVDEVYKKDKQPQKTGKLNSGWRPPAYQAHLKDVYTKFMKIRGKVTPPHCNAIVNKIKEQFATHALRVDSAPADVSPHSTLSAIDFDWGSTDSVAALTDSKKTSIDSLAKDCNICRPFPHVADQAKGNVQKNIPDKKDKTKKVPYVDPMHFELKQSAQKTGFCSDPKSK